MQRILITELNGLLFLLYALLDHLWLLLALASGLVVLFVFDQLTTQLVATAPSRIGRGEAPASASGWSMQIYTLVALALSLGAGLAYAEPIPFLLAVMWTARRDLEFYDYIPIANILEDQRIEWLACNADPAVLADLRFKNRWRWKNAQTTNAQSDNAQEVLSAALFHRWEWWLARKNRASKIALLTGTFVMLAGADGTSHGAVDPQTRAPNEPQSANGDESDDPALPNSDGPTGAGVRNSRARSSRDGAARPAPPSWSKRSRRARRNCSRARKGRN